MSDRPANTPGFWRSVGLLLDAVRQRARGRRRRQRELLQRRTAGRARDWSGFAVLITICIATFANVGAAFLTDGLVAAGDRLSARSDVSQLRLQIDLQRQMQQDLFPEHPALPALQDQVMADDFRRFADRVDRPKHHAVLASVPALPPDPDFVARPGTGLSAMLGSLGLLLWSVMLSLSGEGLDLDVHRRRHPMWEWLFTHPVPPGAVFLAEMLAPLAANPIYYSAPLMPGILYGHTYGAPQGLLAIGLVGVPLTVAASCLGKALEVAVMLRAEPRSRGALIGIMSWLGYASMLLVIVSAVNSEQAAAVLARPLAPFVDLPWPWLGLFLGQQLDGSFSFVAGVLTCLGLAALVTAGATGLSVWATHAGLAGAAGPALSRRRPHARFGANPLGKKELLWFRRDRGALVQVILVPLTAAGMQLFNLRSLLHQATSGWNWLCGVGVLVGTLFLATIGPKSLHSEGSALWLALTWPHGLESLLRAKARLWARLSCVVVGLVLGSAAFLFPTALGPIALVGLGYIVFARSMADKAVTLATVTASSGEPGAVSSNRQWATQLGTLTFAIGVLTMQWQLALVGIVYSTITAAAMWQNFRARLPFLYDPWSERLPPPPTLMHAMIAISCLVEGGAVLTGGILAIIGRGHTASAYLVAYGAAAATVALLTARFLHRRGVQQASVWCWRETVTASALAQPGLRRLVLSLFAGIGLGGALGLIGLAYLAVLRHLPAVAPLLRQANAQMALMPSLHRSLLVIAVLVAPPAEEFLFRGLLYRALDREWGGWRAVLGSGVFFAMYHPPLSWLPVAALGCANALLFKRSGRLAPAVLSHMAYNAIVLG